MNDSVSTPPSRESLLAKLSPLGQDHLLAFWDQLNAAQQRQLAAQIEEIDLTVLRDLREQYGSSATKPDDISPWAALAARAESPPAVRLDGQGLPCGLAEARERGEQALRRGEVGMILVAGGLGTRLGFERPKGMFELGPLSKRPLFQILIEHLLAVGQRFGQAIPLYIMTSSATDAETRKFLTAHDNFGLDERQLRYFCQGSMWALDAAGQRVLLESPDSLFLGPDGHGGMLQALDRSGALDDMRQRGLGTIFYGQIDNPLLQVCDPLLLGKHLVARSEMTTQVVRKRNPLERVGNVVGIDGRVQVIEYSDLPEQAARQQNADGSLKLWAGNLAVHVFDVAFLSRVASQPDALPFHAARKKARCLDAQGNLAEPTQPNAIRFERFIFDLLPSAENALVVEADPAEAFAPVKNADGEATDTPTTARRAMQDQARRMLVAAGVQVQDDVAVEINPLWALDTEEIAAKLPPGTVIDKPTYFSPDGPLQV